MSAIASQSLQFTLEPEKQMTLMSALNIVPSNISWPNLGKDTRNTQETQGETIRT